VVGVDNLNPYYDVQLKIDRLERLRKETRFRFVQTDIAHREAIAALFSEERFDRVFHLAAQAGVRYSLTHPHAYAESNLVGFLNILEGCRHAAVPHLIYASSSSVYGANKKIPFSVDDNVDHPVSLYGATKKANELMAHTYSHLYRLPTTGLRFFTVYGPWGRPDMALFIFTKAIFEGKSIPIYNFGEMERDFTYIDDIVEGVLRVGEIIPTGETPESSSSATAPYRLFNIGNHQPVSLLTFVDLLEQRVGKKADRVLLPIQPGDVPRTFAETEDLRAYCGFAPSTPIEEGIKKFVEWYKKYYRV
jgi:UDP-glucuronate 4-epimerase